MITLPANFQTIFQKDSAIPRRYVAKLTGNLKASPYTEATFYLSTSFFTIGTTQVDGYLLNAPSVKMMIDPFNYTFASGGFTLNVSDDGGFSDYFNTYNFYNREIILYLHVDGIAAVADMPVMFRGAFGGAEIDGRNISINVNSSKQIINKKLDVFTESDLVGFDAYKNLSIIGTQKPIVYGDRIFKYGVDGTSVSGGHTSDISNDMMKAIFLGQDADYIYYYVSNSLLNSINTTNYRIWIYDEEFEKFAMADSSGITVLTTGNETVVKIAKNANFYLFSHPQAAANLVNWTNPDNSIDDDWDTYASSSYDETVDPPPDQSNLAIEFESFANIDVSSVDRRRLLLRTYYTEGVAGDGAFSVSDSNGGISSVDLTSYGSGAIYAITDTRSSFTATQLSSGITFTHNFNGNATHDATTTARVYECVMEFRYQPFEQNQPFGFVDPLDVYVACDGKGGYDHPVDIADDIIDGLGLTSYIDTTSFSAVKTELSGWKHVAIVRETSLVEILKKIGEQSKTIYYVNSQDKIGATTFWSSPSSDYTLHTNDIEVGSFKAKKTSIDKLVNSLKLKYKFNETAQYQELIERDDDTSDTGSQAVYNIVNEKTIEADFISDATTAGYLADHYTQNSGGAYLSTPKTEITFNTAGLRGMNFWNGTTFNPLLGLDVGDVIDLDSSFNSLCKNYGANWSGYFMIIEITKSIDKMSIKALEL